LHIAGKKQNSAAPAARSTGASPKSSAIPSVGELSSGTRCGSSPHQKKVPEDDRLYLTCFCFSTTGNVYNADMFGDGELIQMQMTCAALPSPVYNIMQLVKLYKENSADPEDGTRIPEDMEAVTQEYAAQFIYVSKKTPDPDSVGFKKNRSGWYVSYKNLKAFLMYFDDLMFFRTKFFDSEFDALDSEPKIVLRLSAGLGDSFNLDAKEDELVCSWSVEKESAVSTWPVRIFDLPPPSPTYPLRFILLTLELNAPNNMNVIFGGNSKPFQAEFSTEGIKLNEQKMTGGAYAEYYRVMEHVKIDEDVKPCVEKLKHVLVNILYNSLVMVQLNDKKHNTDLAQQVVSELKKLPNIEVRD